MNDKVDDFSKKKIPLPNHIRPLMEVGIKLAIQLPSQIYELKKKKKLKR